MHPPRYRDRHSTGGIVVRLRICYRSKERPQTATVALCRTYAVPSQLRHYDRKDGITIKSRIEYLSKHEATDSRLVAA
jgi:hypothetical protein